MTRSAGAQEAKPTIHDAEYCILDAQHGARWAAEDKDIESFVLR